MGKTSARRPAPRIAAIITGAIAIGMAVLALSGRGTPGPAIGGAFRLVAPDGRIVTEATFAGKYEVIYFGYASCADICPQTLTRLAAAQGVLGPRAAAVQTLFITLDPARDTPPVLGRYTAQFSPSLLGLTGPPAAVRDVAASFHVYSAAAAGGQIDHSSVLYVMGPDGTFLGPIRAEESSAEMARDLRRYVG